MTVLVSAPSAAAAAWKKHGAMECMAALRSAEAGAAGGSPDGAPGCHACGVALGGGAMEAAAAAWVEVAAAELEAAAAGEGKRTAGIAERGDEPGWVWLSRVAREDALLYRPAVFRALAEALRLGPWQGQMRSVRPGGARHKSCVPAAQQTRPNPGSWR